MLLCGKEIELSAKYTLDLPSETVVDQRGRSIIKETLTLWGLPPLEDDWDWRWMIQKGTIAGNLPKRISKYYHRSHNIDLTPEQIQFIGNTGKMHHLLSGSSYQIDFVNQFDWNAGDFGDEGSCFWGGRRSARVILKENNALAVRFYRTNEENQISGVARAWLVPKFPFDEGMTVFNGYGIRGDPTLEITKMLSHWFEASYNEIKLSNGNEVHGKIFINGDGRGFLLDPLMQSRTIKPTFYDFGWSTMVPECDNCGRTNDLINIRNMRLLCQLCYSRYSAPCVECHERDLKDNMQRTVNNGYLCTSCQEAHQDDYKGCQWCGRFDHAELFIMVVPRSSAGDINPYTYAMCALCAVEHRPTECVDCHRLYDSGILRVGRCRNCYRQYIEQAEVIFSTPFDIEDLTPILTVYRDFF